MKRTIIFLLNFLSVFVALANESYQPEFSTAGFFSLPGTGREVYSMNPAWRFFKGDIAGANQRDFNDQTWKLVSLPNGIEYLPTEASGCINYQGIVWYRKHFKPDNKLKGKRLFLHFEAIMGKSKIWINGTLVKEHFGGYLPMVIDVTSTLKWNEDNVIAVMADNSDDPSYPPGKAQDVLDFTYCGGIYRDCWLVAHNEVYITDSNYENKTAGGGLFISFGKVSEKLAVINLKAHLRNQKSINFAGTLSYELHDKNGKIVKAKDQKINISKLDDLDVSSVMNIDNPDLWSPDSPSLYKLKVFIKNKNGKIIDGYYQRLGIRSIEFKGKDGFWLNGKPYPYPLIGGNRHQDFAVIGNALPNSLHWRDAKKLRDAGMRVIRNAHCPQDPAFMDACDELGLFVIVNTPGWQFWNDKPVFAQRVYDDIRHIVRRDRNHPSVWLWEPILNETWYPADFAKKAKEAVDEEYPYPYCYSGCDATARGNEFFPVLFTHPVNGDSQYSLKKANPNVSYFTREWGDNVDDWNSHNSPSRVNRAWGEVPMLIQAQGYAKPDYQYTCYDVLYRTSRQHVGGCLWHSFDHQRGYHPDPFYGGIMDAFRQPKYSYYMFCAQRPVEKNYQLIAETGPMVYIANAMTPFSPKDITVYSNCEEVRLTYCMGGKTFTYLKSVEQKGMPSPPITFKNVWDVMKDKELSRLKKQQDSYLLAEGIQGGKVVAKHKVMPARRPSKLRLWKDDEGVSLRANGSDIMTVVAAIADDRGTIKRLNNYEIKFSIEGPGKIIGDTQTFTNPRPIQWGTAPILVQSTTKPGVIKVHASVAWKGSQQPVSATLEIPVGEAAHSWIADIEELKDLNKQLESENMKVFSSSEIEDELLQKEKNKIKLKEVEQQQSDFEK